MEKLKNFGKIVGVILGFIVFIAAYIAFWIWIAWLSEKLFLSCICVAAGISYFFLHLSRNKDVSNARNRWISAVTFAIGFCILPITIYFPEQSWVAYVAIAFLGIGTFVWLFSPKQGSKLQPWNSAGFSGGVLTINYFFKHIDFIILKRNLPYKS